MKMSFRSLLFVVVSASAACAVEGPAFVIGGSSHASSLPGQTFRIDLITGPEGARGMNLQVLIDGASVTGTAGNPTLSDGWNWDAFSNPGDIVNSGSILIQNATGTVQFGSPPVTGIAYSFDYTVSPNLPPGETFVIATLSVGSRLGGTLGGLIPKSLAFTVIPEPVTFLLLGAGLVFLRHGRQENR